MQEDNLITESEATTKDESDKTMTPHKLVGTVCSICEQSLQAALHSAGLDTPERDRVVNNYRANVEKAFKDLRRPKHERG